MTLPPVEILWNQGSMAQWRELYRAAPHATLPQSFAYADAMARERGFTPRLGRIVLDGATLGIVQVLERRSLKLFTQRHIHRGPLWTDGAPPAAEAVEATLRLLRRECPRNLFNNLSFLPELPAGDDWAALVARAGFRRIGPGYRTIWIDLTLPEDKLRGQWSATARQRLKKAQKSDLVIDIDPKAQNLPWLMAQEQAQAKTKGFRPLSGRLAVRLRNALLPDDGVLLISAQHQRETAAAGLFFIHGATATYQVGWAGDVGRDTHAMRLILWRAMETLKARGVTALDLGGINPDHAAGVTEFKTSLGGEETESVGLYR
jgi:hypothetical protein